jgi:signal transduction histidine kinase
VSLSRRLTAIAVASSAVALTILILVFNFVLDARLRTDGDNVLRERATAALRGLGTVNGRLSVLLEAPDQGTIDAQTWIFSGTTALEQPTGADPRNQLAAAQLARLGSGFMTVQTTDTRLQALPARAGGRRLGTVVVAASLAPYESTASSALLGSVILGVLTLVAIAALSRWLIRHALRPVARMTAQAATWNERDLSRRFFAGEPRDELSSLASVFDSLLTRLAQGFKREQRLTAEISHELRTPLAKILTEAELSASRDRSTEEYRAALHQIVRHAQDLQSVLETLLAAARAVTPSAQRTSDARECAQHLATSLHETLQPRDKTIEIHCPRPVQVAVESNVVERILSPLLENSARYAQRQITVAIAAVNGEVVFEIRDDGPGISREARESIFDAGFRETASHSDAHAGAGLGLPLARRLARAAGGEVEALASSNGASFAVRLPILRPGSG